MRPADDIRRFIDKAAVSTNPQADKAVLDVVLAARQKAIDKISAATRPSLRSIIMRSPITRLAAAAVVVVAVVLFLGLWDKSAPSAYALEQTIEANRGVRWLHIKNFTTGHDEPREGWIEFSEEGQARNVRASMPEWASPVDGPRTFVWRDGTVQMWIPRQNRLATLKADSIQGQLNTMLQELDPRLALARISDLKAQGKVEAVTEESTDRATPIVVTVTYLPGSEKPGQRKVLFVDPQTKLINAIEVYQLQDGQYRREGRIELQEYNQPIDPKMFDLTNEAPANAERLNLGGVDLGLAQGQLSDEEVATQVVRQFFESLRAGDYDTASRLLPLGNAAALKEQFGTVKILRIVSVGPATLLPGPGNKEMAVPCTIEYEENGKKSSLTLKGLQVQELPERPGRWMIQTLGD
jgi:hypothetical protein